MSMNEKQTEELLRKMEGIIVAMATPLDESGNPDRAALERLVERLVAYGASCLFPLGWCGEQPLLCDEARQTVLEEVCRLAAGRIPVMVGVSEQSLPRALRWANSALDAGADLILVTPPYSVPIPQKLVHAYFQELAEKSGLPLVVYQNDEVSVRVEVDTIQQLSNTPGVIGVKAFMPYMELQAAYERANKPGRFAVISGNEYTFGAALLCGIRHFTMGGPGNICVKWCVSMHQSAVGGDWETVRTKQHRLNEFCDAIYWTSNSPYEVVKYVMSHLGICSARISSPLRQLTQQEKQFVDRGLKKYADVLDPPVS